MRNDAQTQVRCPYCGETTDVHIDVENAEADLVEDCTVCCRPILLHCEHDDAGFFAVSATRDSE